MPRTRRSPVYKYFREDDFNEIFICAIKDEDNDEECGQKFSALGTSDEKKIGNAPSRASNLKRHLLRYHIVKYNELCEYENSLAKPSISTKTLLKNRKRKAQELTVDTYLKPTTVSVSMNRDQFVRGLISMVVENAIALSTFDTYGFRLITGDLAGKLNVSLNRESVRSLVMSEYKNQKNTLKEAVKGKLVHLKMDAATRHRTNYFAINIRFVDGNSKPVTKTLCVCDTKNNHTSDFISNIVSKALDKFGIEIQNVVTIVTDNASNMLAAVNKLEINDDDDSDNDDEVEDSDDSQNPHENEEDQNEDSFEQVCNQSEIPRYA